MECYKTQTLKNKVPCVKCAVSPKPFALSVEPRAGVDISLPMCVPVQQPGVGLGSHSPAPEGGRRWGTGNEFSGFV